MDQGAAIDFNGLVRVVLKLSGLALTVFGAVMLSGLLATLLSGSGFGNLMVYLSQPAVLIFAGLFLWFFPAPVANSVVRVDKTGGDAQTWSDRLVEAGCVLIGLWWLITAVSDLVYHFMVKRAQDGAHGYTQVYSEFGAYVAATVAELVLALALILGARGIVGLLHWLRYGGLETDGRR